MFHGTHFGKRSSKNPSRVSRESKEWKSNSKTQQKTYLKVFNISAQKASLPVVTRNWNSERFPPTLFSWRKISLSCIIWWSKRKLKGCAKQPPPPKFFSGEDISNCSQLRKTGGNKQWACEYGNSKQSFLCKSDWFFIDSLINLFSSPQWLNQMSAWWTQFRSNLKF